MFSSLIFSVQIFSFLINDLNQLYGQVAAWNFLSFFFSSFCFALVKRRKAINEKEKKAEYCDRKKNLHNLPLADFKKIFTKWTMGCRCRVCDKNTNQSVCSLSYHRSCCIRLKPNTLHTISFSLFRCTIVASRWKHSASALKFQEIGGEQKTCEKEK